MYKLMKYLKPFTGMIVAAIFLLFIQAMCDLALPDYMSNIVNKGIQQSGIVNAVPKAVRQSTMDKLVLFMNPDNKIEVISNYTLIDDSNIDYSKYVREYPKLAEEPIYILNNNIDESEVDKINPVMGKAILAVSGMEKAKASAKDGVISFNGMNIPANTDLFELLTKLPKEQVLLINEAINEKFKDMDVNMITQMAVVSVKEEYAALGVNMDKIQNGYILRTGMYMLLISLLAAACTVIVGFLSSRTAAGLSRDLRKEVFTKVENFSNAEFDKFSTASLITRTTNDITQIQMLIIIMIRMVFYAPIMGVGGVIRAIGKSTSMSWIIAVAVAVLLGLIILVFQVAMPKFKVIQKLIDKLNLVTRENLSGMMVIRAFNNQKFEEKRFDKANRDLTNTSLFVNRVMACMFPVMTLIMNGVTLLIVWVGAHQIADSSMQVGDMMAFMQYAMQIIMSFLMMSMMFIMIPRASVSAQRIAEVLETESVIQDPKIPKHFQDNVSGRGRVEFKNVCFRYPGAEEDALKDISFVALPGQTTAFIGSTGAGKTTLVNLILRLYDVTRGKILIGDVDVRDVTQNELRSRIGYVPQKSSLFSGTIESNLKYAVENAADEDIKKSAEIAQVIDFINEKPEGVKSEISQGGTNVSGGQKQRLSIARALVKKPDIYIFDDSFSALDFKTDAALRKALKSQTGTSTVLIVAQRISTIMNAEQIIVLDNGKIAGIGTHRELMDNCRTYQEIAYSQLSKEELA
ncbi:MAG TPA: ABC transporter ATP-binding protein [Clostridiales bacterium]|nr:ABC transporter ATP-binding protein [Clostridiales bacterium]